MTNITPYPERTSRSPVFAVARIAHPAWLVPHSLRLGERDRPFAFLQRAAVFLVILLTLAGGGNPDHVLLALGTYLKGKRGPKRQQKRRENAYGKQSLEKHSNFTLSWNNKRLTPPAPPPIPSLFVPGRSGVSLSKRTRFMACL